MEDCRVHNLIREEFLVSSISTKDIARHLYTRMWSGKVVIAADKPTAFLPSLRKQWLKLARKAQKERASTLNAARIAELTSIVSYMHNLSFTIQYPPDDYS